LFPLNHHPHEMFKGVRQLLRIPKRISTRITLCTIRLFTPPSVSNYRWFDF
jgi:hypothetical protein